MQSDVLSMQNNELLSKEEQTKNMCPVFFVVLCVTSARVLCYAVFVLRGKSKLRCSESNEKLVVAQQVEKFPRPKPQNFTELKGSLSRS
jgi:hypothetical protein